MRWRLSLLAACTLTAACGGGEEPASLGPVARYDLDGDASPGWLEVPFPSDLYRDPDGTIRVPPLGDVAAAWQDAREVLESRRGFCLTCASLIPVTGAIDRASVTGASAPSATATAADSVVLVDVDPSSPQRGRFIPVQSEVNPDDAVVAVRPSPGAILAPSTRYALALTDGVRGVDGAPLRAAETFRARRDGQIPDAGDGLGAALDVLAEVGVARERVMSASVFTTDDPSTHVQAIADLEAQRFADGGPTAAFERLWRADDGSLDALMGTPPADRPGLDNAGGGDDARGVRHATLRFLLAGSFNSPRLLGGEGTEIGDFRRDATGALTLGPVDEKVPFLLSIPEGADVTDLPLAIIHWGIGGRRYNAMAFADTLGAQGIAVLGIDAFQHGARAASATDEIHDFRSNDPALGPDGIAEHENLSVLTRMLGLGGTPPPESSPRWALATLSQLILDARAAARFAQQGDLSALAAADPALAGLRFGEVVFLGESLGNIPGTALATMDSGIGAFAFEGSPGATGDVLCTGPMFRSAIDLIFVPLLGLDDDFDEVNRKLCMHPLLQLFRWGLEPTEPVVLASRLFEDRYAGPPPDVLWQSSARDEVVAFVGPERFYGVLGIPAHGPYALIDPPALELPARANFDTPQGPVTAGTYRFEEAGHGMIGSIRQDSAYAFPVIPPLRASAPSPELREPDRAHPRSDPRLLRELPRDRPSHHRRAAAVNRAAWMLPWLVACGAPVPAVTPLAPCVVRWPAAPHVHTGREGRHATGTVASVEARGLRYEAARFVRDAPLSADERGALVAAVEQGLRARPGVSSLSREGASLVLDFDDGTRGRYRVSFVDASTLIELSVLGAPVDDVDEAARWFFAGAACPAAPGG